MAKRTAPGRIASTRKPQRARGQAKSSRQKVQVRRAAAASVEAAEAPASTARTRKAGRLTAPLGSYRAKVRMYRQGLGDCFLISLKRSQGEDYKILIDCGVILGTPDAAAVMTKVVDNIVEATGGKVDLLLATHEHWDHLSGFMQAAASFERLSAGEVLLAWTEDPEDALAKQLGKERDDALAALQMCDSALQMAPGGTSGPGRPSHAEIVAGFLRRRQRGSHQGCAHKGQGDEQWAIALLPSER
jgi:Metallo-beta-lactamase superfamily